CNGVSPERLVFAKRMSLPDHLARHRLADLFLDTSPCNAHTTASDSLWAGVPVLSQIGETFAGRVAASLLNPETPIDRPRQLHQCVFHVVIWSSRERNRSCSLVSRRSRGRIANPPLHQLEREDSRLAIRGNPRKSICKEIALQRPKTGKFDYLSEPNHSAHSIAFKFFTDDKILERVKGIEPSSSAWKAVALPLSYTRKINHLHDFKIRVLQAVLQGFVLV